MGALASADEAAFDRIVARLHPSVRMLAGCEDTARDAWSSVLSSVAALDPEASLRDVLCRATIDVIRTRSASDPFAAVDAEPQPTVAADRFAPAGHPFAGGWAAPPAALFPEGSDDPALRRAIQHALSALPLVDRCVIVLRDVEGWSAADVCHVLGLRDIQQRVVLHRARASLRRALEARASGRRP